MATGGPFVVVVAKGITTLPTLVVASSYDKSVDPKGEGAKSVTLASSKYGRLSVWAFS